MDSNFIQDANFLTAMELLLELVLLGNQTDVSWSWLVSPDG